MARVLARAKRAGPARLVLVLRPVPVVAVRGPLCAPAGTTTPVIWVPAGFTVKPLVTVLGPALPAKAMLVVPVRPVPVRVTTVPGMPIKGLTAVSVGRGTVKAALLAAPQPTATVTVPAPGALPGAPAGTTKEKPMSVLFVTLARASAPFTVRLVRPVRPVPVTATVLPAPALAGEKSTRLMAGSTGPGTGLFVVVPLPSWP